MKHAFPLLLWSSLLLCAARPLHAQSGCTDSPENSTVVLAVVGGAGALFSTLRARRRAASRRHQSPSSNPGA